MLGSECDFKIGLYVQNLGYTPATNRGPKNHIFRRLRNLTATLMAYIFGTKRDMYT